MEGAAASAAAAAAASLEPLAAEAVAPLDSPKQAVAGAYPSPRVGRAEAAAEAEEVGPAVLHSWHA